MAIAVRAQENIRGIEINGMETKLLQFADARIAAMDPETQPEITQIFLKDDRKKFVSHYYDIN